MKYNIPIFFTLFRVSIIPLFIGLFYIPFKESGFFCAILFSMMGLTDWLDGFLARRLKQTTNLGAFLDPITDKLMIVISLVLIVEFFHSWWITIPVILIIFREIVVLGLRGWKKNISDGNFIKVSRIGKIKTAIQIISVIALIWNLNDLTKKIGVVLLYISVIFSFWSMLQYFHFMKNELYDRSCSFKKR